MDPEMTRRPSPGKPYVPEAEILSAPALALSNRDMTIAKTIRRQSISRIPLAGLANGLSIPPRQESLRRLSSLLQPDLCNAPQTRPKNPMARSAPSTVRRLMSDIDKIEWDEIDYEASTIFRVWPDGSELAWAEEAWQHLRARGLTETATELDYTKVRLTLVMLGRIYEEFCGVAWDKDPQTPLDELTESLEIDPVALGILAASAGREQFDDAGDEYELLDLAIVAATNELRDGIFECLKSAYGDEEALCRRIWLTRHPLNSEDDAAETEANPPNAAALRYVRNGLRP